jgi:AhpD family alkylhydroperoxidase
MIATVNRIDRKQLWSLLPHTSQAVEALTETGDIANLESELVELVNLRCSQINGCAYCVVYHTENLLKAGVSPYKLALVATWEEAGTFSEREMAAFRWAEALTLIADTHVPDDVYAAVSAVFSEAELASLTVSICTINVWNRLSVSFRLPPEIPD